MKTIRYIRIFLSLAILLAAVALLCFDVTTPAIRGVASIQIAPMLLGETIGMLLFWLMVTLIFGRVYCSFVCPVGTLQDFASGLRRRIPKLRRAGHYRPRRKSRYHVLIIYGVSIVISFTAVPLLLEPWNMMRNIASLTGGGGAGADWLAFGLSSAAGLIAGLLSLVVTAVWGWLSGREYCNAVCPLGTLMGMAEHHTLYHIEIDPDRCTNCLKCEDNCKAACIKVVSRYVDNARCVRCFDCVAGCPDKAIRFQINRNRPATPLMRRTKRSAGV